MKRMNELKLALRVDDLDNVATIFAEGVTDGTEVVTGLAASIKNSKQNYEYLKISFK